MMAAPRGVKQSLASHSGILCELVLTDCKEGIQRGKLPRFRRSPASFVTSADLGTNILWSEFHRCTRTRSLAVASYVDLPARSLSTERCGIAFVGGQDAESEDGDQQTGEMAAEAARDGSVRVLRSSNVQRLALPATLRAARDQGATTVRCRCSRALPRRHRQNAARTAQGARGLHEESPTPIEVAEAR